MEPTQSQTPQQENPDAAKQQQEKPNAGLVEALKSVDAKLDAPKAKEAVAALIASVEANTVQNETEIHSALQKAGQLAFDQINGPGDAVATDASGPEAALDAVNSMFADVLSGYGLEFHLGENNKLELGSETPETKLDALIQRAGNAIDRMKSGEPKEIVKALIELWVLLQEALKNPSALLEASDEAKSKGKARERREKIEQSLAGGKSVDELVSEKEQDLQEANGKVESTEQSLQEKKGALQRLEEELSTSTDENRKKELRGQIQQAKQEVQKATQEHAKAVAERDDIQATIDDLNAMKGNVERVKSSVTGLLTRAGNTLKDSSDERLQAIGTVLSDATVKENPDLTMSITVNGDSLGNAIRTALQSKGVTDVPTNAQLGLDANGSTLVSPDALQAYLTGEKGVQETLIQVDKAPIAEAVEQSTNLTDASKENITKALDTPNTWIDVDAATRMMFKGGKVCMQAKESPVSVQVLELDGENTDWKEETDMYFDAKEGVVKAIPEQNVEKRNRLWTYDGDNNKEAWREKTAKEALADSTDGFIDVKNNSGTSIDAEKISEALSTSGVWVDLDVNTELYYDGDQKLVLQNKADPTAVQMLDLNSYGDTGSAQLKEETNTYFNGTEVVKFADADVFNGDLADAGKRERGYKYENHEWQKKSEAEILQHAFDNLGTVAGDTDEHALQNPKNWQSKPPNSSYYWNGNNLYRQSADGTSTEVWDPDAYVQSGLDKWKIVDTGSSYVNGSGQIVQRPDPTMNRYNPTEYTWELDADKSIDTHVQDRAWQDAYKEVAASDTWVDVQVGNNPSQEGIRVGDVIYTQQKASPEKVHEYNLKTGKHKDHTKKYCNGTDVVNLPEKTVRGPFDNATHTWAEYTPEQARNRTEHRKKAGIAALEESGLQFSKNGTVYEVTLPGDQDRMKVRFIESANEWQYSSRDLPWVSASDGLTQVMKDEWDSFTGSDDTDAIRAAQALVTALADANADENTDPVS